MPAKYNVIQLEDESGIRHFMSDMFDRNGKTYLGCAFLDDYIEKLKNGDRADVYLLDNKGFRHKGSPKEMLAEQAIDITKILVPDARIILFSSEPDAQTLALENRVGYIAKSESPLSITKQIINDYL